MPGPGVLKENVIVWCSCVDGLHGPAVQKWGLDVSTPSSGTLTPSSGIVNVWPTVLLYELMTLKGLPSVVALLPTVPVTRPHCWFRSGLPESNWYRVTWIIVCAGSCTKVVCTQWCDLGVIVWYETHVGCAPVPTAPSVWKTRCTGLPLGAVRYFTVWGSVATNDIAANTTRNTTTANMPSTMAMRPDRDTPRLLPLAQPFADWQRGSVRLHLADVNYLRHTGVTPRGRSAGPGAVRVGGPSGRPRPGLSLSVCRRARRSRPGPRRAALRTQPRRHARAQPRDRGRARTRGRSTGFPPRRSRV